MRPQFEVADIFRRYGEDYRKTHIMNDNQRKVMAAIIACRTSMLGGHSEVCDHCGIKTAIIHAVTGTVQSVRPWQRRSGLINGKKNCCPAAT